MSTRLSLLAAALLLTSCSPANTSSEKSIVAQKEIDPAKTVSLSPENWMTDYTSYMAQQDITRTEAGFAEGGNGAVTVAYNALAARAGLEALKQGGNAIDAAMTTASAQITLTGGAPISFFGIMSLVYYDAETDQVYTMNAEWNTVKGEIEPLTIPGGIDFSSDDALRGVGAPSGRTALVGGFMKGLEEAHTRFGDLPLEAILEPSIYIAENGMPVSDMFEGFIEFRGEDLARLPETKAIFSNPDGSVLKKGDVWRQPALAETLRAVAEHGTDYMYGGPWGEKLVKAVQANGGKMTLQDLKDYEVIWDDPLTAELINGYSVYTNPYPNNGGIALIEAQNMAEAAGLHEAEHWSKSGESLRKMLDISGQAFLPLLPETTTALMYPGMDLSPESRVTKDYAKDMLARVEAGVKLGRFVDARPKHSDDVVVIDKKGNIAAITHSINAVLWGKTAINIDGISIGDPGAFQQAAIAKVGPGARLESPTETGILFKDGKPVLGFASMGSGLHQRTMQGLLNVMAFNMDVKEAINAPDFFLPDTDPKTFANTVTVPAGRFSKEVLDEMGYEYREVGGEDARFGGEGKWVAISRDPETGHLKAASHNRNNSAATAY